MESKKKHTQNHGGEFNVLTLDGGGIRGAYTAAVLAEIEKETGEKIIDHFDLVVGTSTGGIIALALASGLSAGTILELFENRGKDIFPANFLGWITQLTRPKYSQEQLGVVLEQYLGNRTLADLPTKVVITAYNATRNDLKRFRNFPIPGFVGDAHLPAVLVAQATAAAPTYFGGIQLPDSKEAEEAGNLTTYLDGGICVNSPVIVGITEALCHFNIPRDKIMMLSVGTLYERFRKGERNINGGYKHWWDDAVGVIMHGQQAAAVNLVEDILPREHFVRITKELPEGEHINLDDTSRIDALIDMGRNAAYAKQNGIAYMDKIRKLFFKAAAAHTNPEPHNAW